MAQKRPFAQAVAAVLMMLALALPGPAAAQGLFSARITVDDKAITGYEINQRAAMLQVLRNPGDPQRTAETQLIEDRLKLAAAEAAGIRPTPEEIRAGMEEFASRANLTLDQFLGVLASAGVAEQSLRDFVRAGLAWREFVRARFGARVQITEDDVDRALSSGGAQSGIRVLLSEIILFAPPPELAVQQRRAERISNLTSTGAFSAEARQYSVTPSRERGGRLDWTPLSQLPPALRPLILDLAPGEVTDPLPLQNAIALFQLRAIEETGAPEPDYAAIEYATFTLPGGRSPETLAQAARIAAAADSCDDLYGAAKGLPEDRLQRVSLPPAELPQDIAIELAKLDAGETSVALTRNEGRTLVLLMLCGRTAAVNQAAERDQVALSLRNQRLTSYADAYLEQLRANARIERP